MDFTLDEHGFRWIATATLPSWRGYRRCGGDAAGAGASDGAVVVVFAPEGRGAAPPTGPEQALCRWLVDNEAAVSRAVKAAVFERYAALQAAYGHTGRQKAAAMPDLSSADDLARLIGLHAVNVHQIVRDDVPYLGFEFCCAWDEEHGLGVLMHGTRAVEVGDADTAILLWIAERDAAD